MKQKLFESQYAPLWTEIEAVLQDKAPASERLPALYRSLCQSLALALQRGYSPALTDYLHRLVRDCHGRLYGRTVERPATLRNWLVRELPQRVRAEWRLVALALAVFFGVALATGLLVWYKPYWAYSFMSPQQIVEMHKMYQPGQINAGRGQEGDFVMFGFYVWNNISIGFRTFAGGIFGGIPALVSLAFNGMHLGVVGSWLSKDPATRNNFWSFVITHASFEMTGLLLSGVAGMRLGLSLIHPGRLSRRHALQEASSRMFPVIVGAAILTFIAAFFEGFWSANASIPMSTKYTVGAICWALVIAYFAFAGRTKA
jgi:uncharacterized membrane protein SpoIIM required for sporulation